MIIGEPPYVRMYAPIHHVPSVDLTLLSRLNHLNCGIDHISFCVRDHMVFAIHDFPAQLLSHDLVGSSLRHFVRRAEEVTAELDACAGNENFHVMPIEQGYPQ